MGSSYFHVHKKSNNIPSHNIGCANMCCFIFLKDVIISVMARSPRKGTLLPGRVTVNKCVTRLCSVCDLPCLRYTGGKYENSKTFRRNIDTLGSSGILIPGRRHLLN